MELDFGPDYLPGTEHLLQSEQQISFSRAHIKRKNDIVLIPQPTNSPNDPLNWRFARKFLHLILVCIVAGLTAATSNDAGSAQDGMNSDLGISWGSMNTAAGVLFIGIGYFTLLLAPASYLYGRRFAYIFCIATGLGGSIWFASIQKTRDSIWSQFLVGISESAAEAQVQLSLSDVYFKHQLGSVLGLYMLATSAGTYLGPLIAGYLVSSKGWRWVGWSGAIASGILLILILFALEETYFDRAGNTPSLETNYRENNVFDETTEERKPGVEGQDLIDQDQVSIRTVYPSEAQKPFWKRIALITPAVNIKGWGFKQYVQRILLTLRVFCFPAVIYSGFQWGFQDALLSFYLTVEDENWIVDPYNYDDTQVAIMSVPCLIGAVLGCYYGGVLSDKFALFMARRNGGILEAETRLWLMFLPGLISPAGILMFGIGTGKGMSWPVPYVGLGFIGFGFGSIGDLSLAYLMEAYPGMVLEGMVGVAVINNTIACIFTFVCQNWLDNQGVIRTFIALGVLDFIIIMTTIPMMIYGKKCRKLTKNLYLRFLTSRDGQ